MLRLSHKTTTILQSDRSNKKTNDNTQFTPSKINKYDSYTPRKRYMKHQQILDDYRQQQISRPSQQYTFQLQHIRPLSQKKSPNTKRDALQLINDNYVGRQENLKDQFSNPYQIKTDSPFNDGRYSLNSAAATMRKNKFVTNIAGKPICQRLFFEGEENQDHSNIAKAKIKKHGNQKKLKIVNIEDELCLTPRRLSKIREKDYSDVNQKLTALQIKMSRFEKRTPSRCSTPKNSRLIQVQFPEHTGYYDIQQEQQSIIQSETSCISQRQHELMSRVSLGRLVEQEQCQTEIQVIQDLSFKISNKLQSIIRHFG